jgi:hypothetical protein
VQALVPFPIVHGVPFPVYQIRNTSIASIRRVRKAGFFGQSRVKIVPGWKRCALCILYCMTFARYTGMIVNLLG